MPAEPVITWPESMVSFHEVWPMACNPWALGKSASAIWPSGVAMPLLKVARISPSSEMSRPVRRPVAKPSGSRMLTANEAAYWVIGLFARSCVTVSGEAPVVSGTAAFCSTAGVLVL